MVLVDTINEEMKKISDERKKEDHFQQTLMRKSYENYLLDTDITMNNNFFEITMYRTEINILLIVKLTLLLQNFES